MTYCSAILKNGVRKGEACGRVSRRGIYCKLHSAQAKQQMSSAQIQRWSDPKTRQRKSIDMKVLYQTDDALREYITMKAGGRTACGTKSGRRAHIRRGEEVCEECRLGTNAYFRQKRQEYREGMLYQLCERFGFDAPKCMWLGCEITEYIEIDHVIPEACGGANTIDNYQLLCRKHNASKGKRLGFDFRLAYVALESMIA